MAKGTLKDKVVNEARNKALHMSHIPDGIKTSYEVCVTDGCVLLTKKNTTQKPK